MTAPLMPSAYGEYYGLWEGSSGAKCDTLAVSATDGGMYFTFYKDGEIMASGCAQVIEEYDQLYFLMSTMAAPIWPGAAPPSWPSNPWVPTP